MNHTKRTKKTRPQKPQSNLVWYQGSNSWMIGTVGGGILYWFRPTKPKKESLEYSLQIRK